MEPNLQTDSKRTLLLFNRKEVFIILSLFVLVALFSFTLGLRMGKTLVTHSTVTESTPFKPHVKEPASTAKPHATETAHTSHEQPDEQSEDATAHGKEKDETSAKAEDLADAELNNEIHETKAGVSKPVVMNYPNEKKKPKPEFKTAKHHATVTDVKGVGSYTLQVGAHRTRDEATKQLSDLKGHGLEADVSEAHVPGKGTWYRVNVGSFESREVAENTGAEWKSTKHLPSFIVQKVK